MDNNGQQTSITQSETPGGADSSPNSRVSTSSVIDLTSPHPSASSAVRSTNGSQHNISRGWRNSEPDDMASDEICAESPRSSLGSPQLPTREAHHSEDQEEKESADNWRHTIDRALETPPSQRRLHLDFTLPRDVTDSNRALPYRPRQVQQQQEVHSGHAITLHTSPQPAHLMTTHTGEPRSRTRSRPRLHHHSPERTAARAYGYELEQELEPRTHRHDRYRWTSEPSPERLPSPVTSPPGIPRNHSRLPATTPPANRPSDQSDEEASLALARYLQQQENIAAYQEFEARRLQEAVEREYQQQPQTPTSALLAGLAGHERNLDPDNMTYEELLRLGEENGDVKKERWRRMAVQVLSSLPTHRWTRGAVEDTCIICQYDFVPNDRAMTLPCAHVFHEDCVGGWIRENNSCPLCKGEIAPM
ncbi:hypothetical protein DVH05_026486 [Phytophthora capsici]|nr:hypothetical protein DVH05_026486 [Phytophthora capsici]